MDVLKTAIDNEDIATITNIAKARPRIITENCLYGKTPLEYACGLGKVSIVELLVQLGGNTRTCMHIAASQGHVLMIEALARLRSTIIDIPSKTGWTPMHIAASYGHVSAIKTLVRLGSAVIDALTNDGSTPIHVAAYTGNTSAIETLVQLGSTTIDSLDRFGCSAIYIAAREGCVLMIETLVRLGSKAIDTPTKSGWTPLHIAANSGRTVVVETLIRLGSTAIDARDTAYQTPLEAMHLEWKHDSEACAKLLVSLGGDCTRISNKVILPSEEETLDARHRVYFSQSLVSRLLFSLSMMFELRHSKINSVY